MGLQGWEDAMRRNASHRRHTPSDNLGPYTAPAGLLTHGSWRPTGLPSRPVAFGWSDARRLQLRGQFRIRSSRNLTGFPFNPQHGSQRRADHILSLIALST